MGIKTFFGAETLSTPELIVGSSVLTAKNDRMYLKNVATERSIDRTSDVATETVTVANTITETTLWTGKMPANSLRAGNIFKVHCSGIVSNGGATAADQITIRVRVGGTQVISLEPATRSMPVGSHWHVDAHACQRTLGTAGSRAVHFHLDIDDVEEDVVAVASIDTTSNLDITITAEWASAAADNTISIFQGFLELKN